MRIARIAIKNFRGIKTATVQFPKHAVLIGDNNTGKTTVLEALDLVLGPDRLNHHPPIDEHDFFQGKYLAKAAAAKELAVAEAYETEAGEAVEGEAPRIEIEVTIAELAEEQKGRFGDYVEFWDCATDTFYEQANQRRASMPHRSSRL